VIDIRPVHGMDEYHAVEDLQKEIWSVEDREIVPAVHFIPACEVGAILLGAFDGGEMIGFVYGFPGFEGDARIIHSDMLAVRPSHRDRGLGTQLKRAQREHALARGVKRITWTFDPLQSRNAYVNLVHLGAIADQYKRDFYGTTTSPLHSAGTDRLWVTWHLEERPQFDLPSVRVEIPSEMTHGSEASEWRMRTRRDLEAAFAAGRVITGFERGQQMSAYLLS
jgi:predicted GNAT superfamily acetyltransferase